MHSLILKLLRPKHINKYHANIYTQKKKIIIT